MCKCGSMQIVQVKPSWADKLFGYSDDGGKPKITSPKTKNNNQIPQI